MTLEHKIDIDWYIWFEEKHQVDQKTVNIGVGWAENVWFWPKLSHKPKIFEPAPS